MKSTKIIMGMPITLEVIDDISVKSFNEIFNYFKQVDNRFSTYKKTSEITAVNNGLLKSEWSDEMKEVLSLSEKTKQQTNGYFNVLSKGKIDPSGIVKGWAIYNASGLLVKLGIENFYIEAGGDIQVSGLNSSNEEWLIGIRNPFNINEIIKVVHSSNNGIATSGNYIRGQHIYNPLKPQKEIDDIMSLTVIGPNIYDADRFATAGFAMGKQGIEFIENLKDHEGYMVDNYKTATFTSGFERYVVVNA